MVTNRMSLKSRIEYLKQIKPRYLKANKDEKGGILNEFCENTGYVRKYAIRRLAPQNTINPPKTINRKRGCFYTNEDIHCLSKVWEIMDYPCGQRLEPILPNLAIENDNSKEELGLEDIIKDIKNDNHVSIKSKIEESVKKNNNTNN